MVWCGMYSMVHMVPYLGLEYLHQDKICRYDGRHNRSTCTCKKSESSSSSRVLLKPHTGFRCLDMTAHYHYYYTNRIVLITTKLSLDDLTGGGFEDLALSSSSFDRLSGLLGESMSLNSDVLGSEILSSNNNLVN